MFLSSSFKTCLGLIRLQHQNNLKSSTCRLMTVRPTSGNASSNQDEKIRKILGKKFPEAESINVEDVSGGCGAMFEIEIRSSKFKGLSLVKQHRLVTEALKEEIKDMHGLRIHTSP